MIKFEEWLLDIEYPVPIHLETADLEAGEPRTMLKFEELC